MNMQNCTSGRSHWRIELGKELKAFVQKSAASLYTFGVFGRGNAELEHAGSGEATQSITNDLPVTTTITSTTTTTATHVSNSQE